MDGWPPHCWRYPRQNVTLLPPYLDTSPIPDRLLILAARATTKCLKAFKSGEVRCPLTILEVCLSIWDVSNYALVPKRPAYAYADISQAQFSTMR